MAKIKIVIAGIGGVGGYFGGRMARHFHNSSEVAVYFIARGAHLKEIQTHGLTVVENNNSFVAIPEAATDDPLTIGVADFIVICTKSYDLENMVQHLHPCINRETIILPLLNGVDSRERIKSILPNNLILEGCAYIVSRIAQPGTVENTGNVQAIYFGTGAAGNSRLRQLETIFRDAGVDATYAQNILQVIWEKYVFISPTATATSFFNNTIGAMAADDDKLKTVAALIEEVKQVAGAKQIPLPADITEKTINKLKAMPYAATSSMYRDFQAGNGRTELESLTGYVVQMGYVHNISTPVYTQLYEQLKNR